MISLELKVRRDDIQNHPSSINSATHTTTCAAACGCFVHVEHHAVVYNTDKKRYICVTKTPENFENLYFIRDDAFSEDITALITTLCNRIPQVVDSETLLSNENGANIKSCKHFPKALNIALFDAHLHQRVYLTAKHWKLFSNETKDMKIYILL